MCGQGGSGQLDKSAGAVMWMTNACDVGRQGLYCLAITVLAELRLV